MKYSRAYKNTQYVLSDHVSMFRQVTGGMRGEEMKRVVYLTESSL